MFDLLYHKHHNKYQILLIQVLKVSEQLALKHNIHLVYVKSHFTKLNRVGD